MENEFTEPPPFPGQQIIHAIRLVNDRILSSQDGIVAELANLPLDAAMVSLYGEIIQIGLKGAIAGRHVVHSGNVAGLEMQLAGATGTKRPYAEDVALPLPPLYPPRKRIETSVVDEAGVEGQAEEADNEATEPSSTAGEETTKPSLPLQQGFSRTQEL